MDNVKRAHLRNYEFSKLPEFPAWMVASMRQTCVRVMRIHAAGDFYSLNYLWKWQYIISRSPDITFFAYTRSWRQEELLPSLIRLSQLPNMQLWWSLDRETGPAPLIRGIRRSYMAISDADARYAPDDCDLVFRDDTKTVMKKANGVQVCPPENGVKTKKKITCTQCGICWREAESNWESFMTPYLEKEGAQEITVPEFQYQAV